MKHTRLVSCSTLLAIAVLAIGPARAVPGSIDLRTRVFDAAGTPVEGSLAVGLSLWDAPAGGGLLYAESHAAVDVLGGLLSVGLGGGTVDAGSPLASVAEALAASDPVYLEFELDGEILSPRRALDGVPYAFVSDTADDAVEVEGTSSSDLHPRVTGSCPPGQMISDLHPSGGVTCRTDEGAEYFAGDGLSLDALRFDADPSQVQLRVGADCPEGSYARGIGADGSLICVPDADEDTQLSAGPGVSISPGNEIAPDPAYVQRRIARICPDGSAVRSVSEDGDGTCEPLASGDITRVTTFTASGLSGGCDAGTCALAIDPGRTQRRLTQSCGADQAIRQIFADGSVACVDVGPGNLDGVSAADGSGLDASCDAFGNQCSVAVDFAETQRRPSGFCPANQAMRTVAEDGSIVCQAVGTGDITGVVGSSGNGVDGGCQIGDCSLTLDPTDFMEPPSASFNAGDVLVNQLTVTPEDIATRTITAPSTTGGHVVAMAGGEIECNGNCASDLYSILTTSTIGPSSAGRFTRTTADNLLFGTFISDIFPIAAGETLTIRWRGGIDPGQPSVRVFKPRMSVVFLPN